MIDARRMEVYASVFDAQLNKVQDTAAMVIDENTFEDLSKDHRLWLFGDGAPKLSKLFENQSNINIIDGFKPSAAYMRLLAEQALQRQQFVDVAYFEPFYLKDFVAGKPHVKGLV
jgi:tRNA threonylcarbamoyladenosine biosynthesis protein TsaB